MRDNGPGRHDMKATLKIWTIFACFLLILGLCTIAQADTILFPVIATNYPNVITIISVMNYGGASDSSDLLFSYSSKAAFIDSTPNHAGGCYVDEGVLPTWVPDLVSFDASGSFNSGYALFNDPDDYGGPFTPGFIGPTRAYLLVTNSTVGGTRQDVGYTWSLGGEAIVMDIMTGAAWGYTALNDYNREDFSFYSSGVANVLEPGWLKRFSFFPPSEWTTKFFITPIGTSMEAIDSATTVRILGYGGSSVGSITDRGNTTYNFSVSQFVSCTAAVNLSELMDATAWAGIYYSGGWGWLEVVSGDSAVVYKLEYVVDNPTYGVTNNNAYILSTLDGP
jgi:hypothetical protein